MNVNTQNVVAKRHDNMLSNLTNALAAWDKRWPYGPQKEYERVIVDAAKQVAIDRTGRN